MPTPYGGKERQIMVDLDPQAAAGQGHLAQGSGRRRSTPTTSPSRPAWPASTRRNTRSRSTTRRATAEAFNDIPIKVVNGATIYMRDVAQVRDGFTTQTTVVRRDGKRGALVTLLKNGNASTLDIVNQVKAMMPRDQGGGAARACEIELLFDQSLFVTAAVEGVVAREHHRRAADRGDDPAVPRQLAEHADRRGVDSAVDPVVDRAAVRAGPFAQRDDARRPGAGGRHPGR